MFSRDNRVSLTTIVEHPQRNDTPFALATIAEHPKRKDTPRPPDTSTLIHTICTGIVGMNDNIYKNSRDNVHSAIADIFMAEKKLVAEKIHDNVPLNNPFSLAAAVEDFTLYRTGGKRGYMLYVEHAYIYATRYNDFAREHGFEGLSIARDIATHKPSVTRYKMNVLI